MAYTNSKGQTQSSLAEINITPLVDVVLVLLVIFMITAPVLQSGIEVAVPTVVAYNQFTARIRVFASAIDDFCRELLNSLDEIPVRPSSARMANAEGLREPAREPAREVDRGLYK